MTVHGFNVLHPFTEPPTIPVRHWRLWDVGVTWKDINPEKGVWNYDRLDMLVSLAERQGADICLVLGMTPRWAAKDPNAPHFAPWIGPGSNSPPYDLKLFEEYVIHTVNRYRGRIKYYQIWNEPQLADFWYPYSDIKILGEMTRIAYDIIKVIDQGAVVVASPVLLRPSSGGIRRGLKYLLELKKNKWPVDIYAAHVYPEKNKNPKRFRYFVRKWKAALKVLRAPKKKLWITEMNYNLHHGAIPEQMLQPYMRMTDAYCNQLGISRIYWYAWGQHSSPGLFGINFTKDSVGAKEITKYL